MAIFNTPEAIADIKKCSLIVSETLGWVGKHLRPGIRLLELDQLAETFVLSKGAEPAFKGFKGYPATLCLSVNEQVVHGIPGDYQLQPGDVVSVDCGVKWNGLLGDSAYTYVMKDASEPVMELLRVTKHSLYLGARQAIAGQRTGDIGSAIQQFVEREHGFHIVRELVGHGVGASLHEEPEVPNYGKRGAGARLMEGMVICIEPMVNIGTRQVRQLKDGWTIVTADRSISAHYELMVHVAKGAGVLLNHFEFCEAAERENPSLEIVDIQNMVIVH